MLDIIEEKLKTLREPFMIAEDGSYINYDQNDRLYYFIRSHIPEFENDVIKPGKYYILVEPIWNYFS